MILTPPDYMKMAHTLAETSGCVRHQQAILAINRRGRIISYGSYSRFEGDCKCSGPCQAVHPTVEMLSECPDIQQIDRIVTTHFPCVHCTYALLKTSATVIYYNKLSDEIAKGIWHSNRNAYRVF